MVDVENISEIYWSRLSSTNNPGPVLARFLGELLRISIDKSHIIMMNRLLRIYDRFLILLSVMDLENVKELNKEQSLYPLLFTICRRRFEAKHSTSVIVQYESLDREINSLNKQIEKMNTQKIKIPSSDDLGKDN
jgi:hypothetical protein